MAAKKVVWLNSEVKSPPFSLEARREVGFLLRVLQSGDLPCMPHSRPMPSIGSRCHELRVIDEDKTWRVVYRVGADEVVVAHVFAKKSRRTPPEVIRLCRRRLKHHDEG